VQRNQQKYNSRKLMEKGFWRWSFNTSSTTVQLVAEIVHRNRIPNNEGCSRILCAKESQVQDNGCVKHKKNLCIINRENILLMMFLACSVVHSVFFNNENLRN
jgi:hypothetical protein